MDDFFENQNIYLDIAKSRIDIFIADQRVLLEKIYENVVIDKISNHESHVRLNSIPNIECIKLSRDFGCITNELRSILDSAVVALSVVNGGPNTHKNKLGFQVVRSENSKEAYYKKLLKYKIPEKLIEIILHTQPINNFGTDTSTGENIIEILDEINNENKHRKHLGIILPKFESMKKIELQTPNGDVFTATFVPINDGNIAIIPFLKITTTPDCIIELTEFNIRFPLLFGSDNGKYPQIDSVRLLINSWNIVACCVEMMRLGIYPDKMDFFGIPLIRGD